MMNRLVTPRQVVDLAFGEAEYLSEQAVSDADIVAATSRYVVPIVGEELAERLAEGEYSELLNEYVAPALAAAVRYMIQPLISLRTGDSGLVAPKGDYFAAPTKEAVAELQLRLKCRMRELLRRLSDHLNINSRSYAEYSADSNILNRCLIDGGVVQIL